MNMKQRMAVGLVLALISTAVLAAPASSEARGTIVDTNDEPVQGIKVTYSPESNPTLKYSGKTNKKGRYFIQGLFTGKENDPWKITIEAEGYVPLKMVVESRNVNRVLMGEIYSRQENPEAALASYERCLELDPDHRRAKERITSLQSGGSSD